MLSILLPSYQVDLTELVKHLLDQARVLAIPFELIIMDDATPVESVRQCNQLLAQEPEVTYLQQSENQGRSKIRNQLVETAQYPCLLIMDCDAGMVDDQYLARYWNYRESHPELPSRYVISGGLCYREEKPAKDKLLRWKYGVEREVRTAAERNEHPYRSFTPFNIFTTKETFLDNGFDESFTAYGYEDTLWGYQLRQKEIPMIHIDNPLYHDGLDTNEAFLAKTRQAVENLYRLMQEERVPDEFRQDSRLLRTYRNFQQKGLLPICRWYYKMFRQTMEASLKHAPSLKLLDSYKLFYLAFMSC
ncbi:MAG: glycosyltransferase family 2 protein [Bacteroidales bacterium]|nr:glycosyltransferase family 2 protein [Bacteroidales bacterium]